MNTLAFMEGLVLGLGVYFAIGFVVALAFSLRGMGKIDPAARGAGWGFRVLVFPGLMGLWPLMVGRWLQGERS